MNDMNPGYEGYSMSRNAARAYAAGERPLSGWTKADMLSVAESIRNGSSDILSSLRKEELASLLLRRSSWHHTSKFVNRTDFYAIDEDRLESVTEEQVQEIIAGRSEKKPAPVTEKYVHASWEEYHDRRKCEYEGYGVTKNGWFETIEVPCSPAAAVYFHNDEARKKEDGTRFRIDAVYPDRESLQAAAESARDRALSILKIEPFLPFSKKYSGKRKAELLLDDMEELAAAKERKTVSDRKGKLKEIEEGIKVFLPEENRTDRKAVRALFLNVFAEAVGVSARELTKEMRDPSSEDFRENAADRILRNLSLHRKWDGAGWENTLYLKTVALFSDNKTEPELAQDAEAFRNAEAFYEKAFEKRRKHVIRKYSGPERSKESVKKELSDSSTDLYREEIYVPFSNLISQGKVFDGESWLDKADYDAR